MPVLTATERIGTVIDGKYAVARVLGQGGMGVVFEATHTWTGRRVALKLIKPDLVEPARDARLLLEARAAAALSHPNVVQVLDMGATDDGVSYLVMELLEGRTLKEELLARGALPAAEVLAIALPLFGAIAVAHDRGIVHRDLKPANILLSRDSAGRRVPKLLDFGIAKVIAETGMTNPGAVLGTPHYLSPEQAGGVSEVGPAADVWALGVIVYECLSGRLPFPGEHPASVLQRVLNQPAPPLGTHAQQVGLPLAQAVDRALQREPRLRYDGARSFARALLVTARDCQVELPVAPDPTGLPEWSAWVQDGSMSTESSLADSDPRRAPEDAAHPATASANRNGARRAAWSFALLAGAGLLAYLIAQQQGASPSGAKARAAVAATMLSEKPAGDVATPAPLPRGAAQAAAVAAPVAVVDRASAATAGASAAGAPSRQPTAQPRIRRKPAPASLPAPDARAKLIQSW